VLDSGGVHVGAVVRARSSSGRQAWRASGVSLQRFASQRGLVPQRLRYWKQKLQEAEPARSKSLPLTACTRRRLRSRHAKYKSSSRADRSLQRRQFSKHLSIRQLPLGRLSTCRLSLRLARHHAICVFQQTGGVDPSLQFEDRAFIGAFGLNVRPIDSLIGKIEYTQVFFYDEPPFRASTSKS
jgi:hypothetical protein